MSEHACDGEPITTIVVEAIAEAEDCDPTDLEALYRAVDTDALDALFDDGTPGHLRDGQLSFVYSGYEVTISSDGAVDLGETVT